MYETQAGINVIHNSTKRIFITVCLNVKTNGANVT